MGGKVVECEVDRILERGIEQGRRQGVAQGVAQGIAQGRSQLIENMLYNKKTPEEIAAFCNCDLQEVKEVQKRMIVNI